MNVFFCPEVTGNRIVLDENESLHASRVLRMNVGDAAWLLDGKGHKYLVDFLKIHHKKCELEVKESTFESNVNNVHIAIAPTKLNDRMEWFLEKVTELGVNSVTPVICDRSERRTVNHERYLRITVAALKQSMNLWLPELKPAIAFDEYIDSTDSGFIAHCNTGNNELLTRIQSLQPEYRILIGPEGDFSENEISTALTKGWKAVSLGKTRLRTETAGVIACNSIMVVHELLSSHTTNK